MTTESDIHSLVEATRERDLLRCIFAVLDGPRPLDHIDGALAQVASCAGAERAYLELGEPRSPGLGVMAAVGFDGACQRAALGEHLARDEVREALASGRAVESQGRLSVPVGAPMVGLVHLEGANGLAPDARRWAELFARHLPWVARRLVIASASAGDDPTVPHRARLDGEAKSIVGKSAELATVLGLAASVAPLEVPVLLVGPTGTGKSELAGVIARSSARRSKPLITINCAVIPAPQVETELFGAQASDPMGDATSAGAVARADGGTLVLDAIDELAPAAQARLVPLIQDGNFWPLGASQPVRADVRIIATSSAALARRVAEGRMREDLYYRLDVVPIEVPALQDRRNDIPLLADHFLARARERNAVGAIELSLAARQALMSAEWPGHVRQLGNAVLGAAIRAHAEGAAAIEPRHLLADPGRAPAVIVPWADAIREAQRRILADALRATGNIAEAGRRLGIARSYVYELVKNLNVRELLR